MHDHIVIVEGLGTIGYNLDSIYRTQCNNEVEACIPAMRGYSSGLGEQTQLAPGLWVRTKEGVVAVTIIQVDAIEFKQAL